MHSLRQRINARDESGFTLIELLVVLIIIGVLLAIAIPSYLGFQQKAQQTAAASDVRSAIPDAEAYYSDFNSYTDATNPMTASYLQSQYDTGLKIVGVNGATSGIVTATGGANTYCISAQDGTKWSYVVGPGGPGVQTGTDDYCTSTYVAS